MDDFRQSNSAEDEIEWFSDLWIDQMNYIEICNHSNMVIVHCQKLGSWEFLLFHSDFPFDGVLRWRCGTWVSLGILGIGRDGNMSSRSHTNTKTFKSKYAHFMIVNTN